MEQNQNKTQFNQELNKVYDNNQNSIKQSMGPKIDVAINQMKTKDPDHINFLAQQKPLDDSSVAETPALHNTYSKGWKTPIFMTGAAFRDIYHNSLDFWNEATNNEQPQTPEENKPIGIQKSIIGENNTSEKSEEFKPEGLLQELGTAVIRDIPSMAIGGFVGTIVSGIATPAVGVLAGGAAYQAAHKITHWNMKEGLSEITDAFPSLKNPITNYLQAKDDDPTSIKFAKGVMDNAILDTITLGMFKYANKYGIQPLTKSAQNSLSKAFSKSIEWMKKFDIAEKTFEKASNYTNKIAQDTKELMSKVKASKKFDEIKKDIPQEILVRAEENAQSTIQRFETLDKAVKENLTLKDFSEEKLSKQLGKQGEVKKVKDEIQRIGNIINKESITREKLSSKNIQEEIRKANDNIRIAGVLDSQSFDQVQKSAPVYLERIKNGDTTAANEFFKENLIPYHDNMQNTGEMISDIGRVLNFHGQLPSVQFKNHLINSFSELGEKLGINPETEKLIEWEMKKIANFQSPSTIQTIRDTFNEFISGKSTFEEVEKTIEDQMKKSRNDSILSPKLKEAASKFSEVVRDYKNGKLTKTNFKKFIQKDFANIIKETGEKFNEAMGIIGKTKKEGLNGLSGEAIDQISHTSAILLEQGFSQQEISGFLDLVAKEKKIFSSIHGETLSDRIAKTVQRSLLSSFGSATRDIYNNVLDQSYHMLLERPVAAGIGITKEALSFVYKGGLWGNPNAKFTGVDMKAFFASLKSHGNDTMLAMRYIGNSLKKGLASENKIKTSLQELRIGHSNWHYDLQQKFGTQNKYRYMEEAKDFSSGLKDTAYSKILDYAHSGWETVSKGFSPIYNVMDDIRKTLGYNSTIVSEVEYKLAEKGLKGAERSIERKKLIDQAINETSYQDLKLSSTAAGLDHAVSMQNSSRLALVNNIRDKAKKEGRRLSYTESLNNTFAGKLLESVNYMHPAVKTIVRTAMPFVTTGTNMAKQQLMRTPLGLFSKELRDTLKKGGREADFAIARMGVFSGGTAIIWDKYFNNKVEIDYEQGFRNYDQDIISGQGPLSASKRQSMIASGWIPYSVRLGDKRYKIDQLGPIGAMILLPAIAMDMISNGKIDYDDPEYESSTKDLITSNILAFGHLSSNSSFMQNFIDLIGHIESATEGKDKGLSNFAGKLSSTIIPRSIGDIVDFTSFVVNYGGTEEDAKILQDNYGFFGQWANKLGINTVNKLDMWGDPITRNKNIHPLIPFQYSNAVKDPVMLQLHADNINISMPKRIATLQDTYVNYPIDKETMTYKTYKNNSKYHEQGDRFEQKLKVTSSVKLDSEQYHRKLELIKATGIKEEIAKIIDSKIYKQASRSEKQRIILSKYQSATKAANLQLLEEYPNLKLTLIERNKKMQYNKIRKD